MAATAPRARGLLSHVHSPQQSASPCATKGIFLNYGRQSPLSAKPWCKKGSHRFLGGSPRGYKSQELPLRESWTANPTFPGNSVLIVFVNHSLTCTLLCCMASPPCNATSLRRPLFEQNQKGHFPEDIGFHPLKLVVTLENLHGHVFNMLTPPQRKLTDELCLKTVLKCQILGMHEAKLSSVDKVGGLLQQAR